MEESYEINYIAVKGGSIKIRYSVSPMGGVPEGNIVSRSDKPHEDFQRAWGKNGEYRKTFSRDAFGKFGRWTAAGLG